MFQTNLFSDVASVERYISEFPTANVLYRSFKPEWKSLVQDYFLSKRTLPLTYDPFFKRIFNPDIHPDRLSRLISAILGQEVTVTAVLSNEDTLLKGNSLLIMDIVVRLADGSITTVEIQKLSVAFPAERMSCYSADLLLRQYEQVKNQMKKNFNYSAINKVYTIVIFENTDEETTYSSVYAAFHAPDVCKTYLHHGKTTFDTGLSLEFLQEFYLISLDVFREVGYAKDDSELTAWLSLLATSTYEEAELLCQKYPWMEEIFEEISEYVHNPEEVLGMFSEALKIMDDNMYQFMADRHKALMEKRAAELKEKEAEIQNKEAEIQNKEAEIQNKEAEIQNKEAEIQNKEAEIQNLYQLTIQLVKKHNGTKEDAEEELIQNCNLSPELVTDLVEKYW